jgi:hypothetical protein
MSSFVSHKTASLPSLPATGKQKAVTGQTAFRIRQRNIADCALEPRPYGNAGAKQEIVQLAGYRAAQQGVYSEASNKLRALADVRRSYFHHMGGLLGTRSDVAYPQPLGGVKHR